jgi:hypothetical protein
VENEAKAAELRPLAAAYAEEVKGWAAVESKYGHIVQDTSHGAGGGAGGGSAAAVDADDAGDPLASVEGAAVAAKYASVGALADLTHDKLADVFFGVSRVIAGRCAVRVHSCRHTADVQVDALAAALRTTRATIERAAAVTTGASAVLRARAFATLNVDREAGDAKAALRGVLGAGTMPPALVSGDDASAGHAAAGAGGAIDTAVGTVHRLASGDDEAAGEEVASGLRSPSPSRSAVKAGRVVGLRRRSTRSAGKRATTAADTSRDADLDLGGAESGGAGGGRGSVPTETPQILRKIKARGAGK